MVATTTVNGTDIHFRVNVTVWEAGTTLTLPAGFTTETAAAFQEWALSFEKKGHIVTMFGAGHALLRA